MTNTRANPYVLFPLGGRRFALPAAEVTELARPDRLQTFPHTTPLLAGVLVRRGRVVPVCDVAPVLVGPDAPTRKFYLIAVRRFASSAEWTAIPVTGECELVSAEAIPPKNGVGDYVTGVLAFENETVEVVDLEKVIATGARE